MECQTFWVTYHFLYHRGTVSSRLCRGRWGFHSTWPASDTGPPSGPGSRAYSGPWWQGLAWTESYWWSHSSGGQSLGKIQSPTKQVPLCVIFSSILKIRNNLLNLLSAFQTFMVKHFNSYFYQVFSKNMWFFIKDHGLHCHRYLCPCFCCIEFDLLSTFKELVPYSESVGENNVANSSHQFLKGDIAVCRWHLFLYNRYIGSGLIDHAYILQGVTNKFYNRN